MAIAGGAIEGPVRAAAGGARAVSTVASLWMNGVRLSADGPHVSARDRGLTLADGLFETMRVRHGCVFRLDRHLDRLQRGLDRLAIAVPHQLRDWVLAAIEPADDAAVRLTVTRGAGAAGVAPPVDLRPTVIVAINAMPEFPRSVYESGLAAIVASGRRNERSMTAGLKTLQYTDAIAAYLEARHAGVDEALFLDTEGHWSEATSSNLFVWNGLTLQTPPVSCGALPGITRATVLEIAGELGIPTAERALLPVDLNRSGEAFLTSSLRGIAPLVAVGGAPIGDGGPGPLTRQIAAAHASLVERECGAAAHDAGSVSR
jgi:branched-chain amino acid aminotransferase